MLNKNRGASMVEFALVMPAFIMIFYSMVYGAFTLHDIKALNDMARAGARYAVVQDSGISQEDKNKNVQDYIIKEMGDSLYVYRKVNGTNIKIEEIDMTIGNNKSESSFTEKGIKVSITAYRKDTLPALFLNLLPKDANGNVWLSTISSEITMRKEE